MYKEFYDDDLDFESDEEVVLDLTEHIRNGPVGAAFNEECLVPLAWAAYSSANPGERLIQFRDMCKSYEVYIPPEHFSWYQNLMTWVRDTSTSVAVSMHVEKNMKRDVIGLSNMTVENMVVTLELAMSRQKFSTTR